MLLPSAQICSLLTFALPHWDAQPENNQSGWSRSSSHPGICAEHAKPFHHAVQNPQRQGHKEILFLTKKNISQHLRGIRSDCSHDRFCPWSPISDSKKVRGKRGGVCKRGWGNTEVPLSCILAEVISVTRIWSPWWGIPRKITQLYPRNLRKRCPLT